MATAHNSVRQSVSLPTRIAKRVLALAETKKTSASRVLVDLIETGLQAKEAQHQRFFELTDKLAETTDPAERKRLQEQLAGMTFAELVELAAHAVADDARHHVARPAGRERHDQRDRTRRVIVGASPDSDTRKPRTHCKRQRPLRAFHLHLP